MSLTFNDFVIRFANVNGSGSASANGMFAKALFRMGIPVATRNIFPSNIQGLPTWFEVRVSEKDYLGRREGVDIMVAMNAETMVEDVASLKPGGYLHCATDWEPYAEQMLEVLRAESRLVNSSAQADGYATKPDYRPETKFERRGLRLGHGVWDLVFIKR